MKNKKLISTLILTILTLSIYTHAYAIHFYDTAGTIYESAVERLADLGVVSGVSTNTYDAKRNVTRAEFAKLITESSLSKGQRDDLLSDDADVRKFSDINDKEWYYPYVTIAINRGYMKGFDDGTFKPNDNVTYEQISKMVIRALGHTYLNENDPRGWQAQYVDKMYDLLLFNNTLFDDIKGPATRGDCANIIWNMLRTETWRLYKESEVEGFTYTSEQRLADEFGQILTKEGFTNVDGREFYEALSRILFNKVFKDHVLLKDVTLRSYYEYLDYLYLGTKYGSFRLFNQSNPAKFTEIGGTSDLILKRVMFPDMHTSLEVCGVSPDIGYQLYSGKVDQLKAEGFDINKILKLNTPPDYAYLLANPEAKDDERVRAIATNTKDFIIVEKIKIEDKAPEGYEKPDLDIDPEKFKKESTRENIAYVYANDIDVKIRTITVNDSISVPGDAIVFLDNKRILWSAVKEGDILTDIGHGYYMLSHGTNKQEVLSGYTVNEDNYSITTAEGHTYETYENTKFEGYNTQKIQVFSKMKDADRKKVLGKKVRITFDFTDRVVKIEQIEPDDIKRIQTIANLGIYQDFIYSKTDGAKYNRIKLIVDGKPIEYRIASSDPTAVPGDLIAFEFEEGKTNSITKVKKITGSVQLTDDLSIAEIKKEDAIKVFADIDKEKYRMFKIDYQYAFGKYEEVESYELKEIAYEDLESINGDSKEIKFITMKDTYENYTLLYVLDHSTKVDMFFGLVKKVYTDKDEHHVVVDILGGKEIDIKVSSKNGYNANEFISFKRKNEDSVDIVERYTTKVLGYYKDLIVKSAEVYKDVTTSVKLEGDNTFNVSEWKIKAGKTEYDLNDYTVVLLTMTKDSKGYHFKTIKLLTKDNLDIKEGDRIAINEVEDTAIVYRGYTD